MAVDGQGPTLLTRWTAARAGAAMAGAGKLASVQQDLPGPVVVGQPPAAPRLDINARSLLALGRPGPRLRVRHQTESGPA
jgi:hypothetical protein